MQWTVPLFDPDLGASVRALSASGLLPESMGAAHDLLTRYLVVSRLVSPASTEPPEATKMLVAQRCGAKDWADLLAMLDAARQSVSREWRAIVDSVPPSEPNEEK